MKTCKNPNCTVPVNELAFNKKASSKDGLATVCKVCKAIKHKLYRENNNERIKEVKRQYRINNPELLKETNAKYYSENKEKIAAVTKEYRQKHKEELRQKKSEYYKSPAGVLASKNAKNTRRALKQSTSDGTVTKDYLDTLLTAQRNRCYYCSSELDLSIKGAVHLDHYIPISNGGAHSCGNVVWACSSCNLTKGANIPDTPLTFSVLID